jgi:plastocyanin
MITGTARPIRFEKPSRIRSAGGERQTTGPSKRTRNISISTILILFLAGLAAVAYYAGTPPPLATASVTTNSCSPASVQIVIPQGVGTNSSLRFQPPAVTVVVGVNNTVVWNDRDTSAQHDVVSVSVPPHGSQWDIEGMTGGNTYCITLTAPGTYTYEIFLNYVVEGTIVVKSQ